MSNTFSLEQESHVGFAFLGITYPLVLSRSPTSCYTISWAAPPGTVPNISYDRNRANKKKTSTAEQDDWHRLQAVDLEVAATEKKPHICRSFNRFSLETQQEPLRY